jgi:hypothetical protein
MENIIKENIIDEKINEDILQQDKQSKRKAYMLEYRKKNKDKISNNKLKYRQNNVEKIKQGRLTENAIKTRRISHWKSRGLIGDYNLIYDMYMNATNCECCNTIFKSDFYKCCDHCHITGEFRKILCRSCNTLDRWKLLMKS